MLGRRCSRALEHMQGHRAQSAIPHPKGIDGHTQQSGKFLLREIGGTTKFAQLGHGVNTMPFTGRAVKRPPEYQTGDQRQF